MEILIKASQLIASLSLLVIIHELGHFMFSKLFKCRVEKFYLFFDAGFSLFKHQIGETEYGIGWLPLGGYVKISGMIDESMDKDQLAEEPKEWEFRAKPAWQRLLIMAGGVMNNIILAFVIYIAIIFTWGTSVLPNENVLYGSSISKAGEAVGFVDGDKIVSIDKNAVEYFDDIQNTILLTPAKEVVVNRSGKEVTINLEATDIKTLIQERKAVFTPRRPFYAAISTVEDNCSAKDKLKADDVIKGVDGKYFEFEDQFQTYIGAKEPNDNITLNIERDGTAISIPLTLNENRQIGIGMTYNAPEELLESSFLQPTIVEYSLLEAIPAGVSRGVDEIGSYINQLKLMFTPELELYKEVGGFISIGKIFPSTWSWHRFWGLTALLSIMLAVLNILPIPALDGGHILFLFYEIITGKPASEKVMEYAQMGGMIFLLCLLIFANGNDILKLFS